MSFRPTVLEEAEQAKPATMAKREDWRDVPLVTIDPADAKDHDDAVFAEPDPDDKNPGGFIATVAIADVAAYVTPDSPLDREALKRGNSVYFPDRVVPMLPERISNDLCSLRERQDRPALAVRMTFGADGRKISAHLPPRHDALGGEALLSAGAGGDRRRARRQDRADPRAGAEAALGGLRGAEARPRCSASRSSSTCPSARSCSSPTARSTGSSSPSGSMRTSSSKNS